MEVRLENIRKAFDEKVAVDDLSLTIPQGLIYGIIGPNGAGKTTTIRMTMNITVPDSGQVLIDGKPRPKDFNDRVGYLPEEKGLYPKMTAVEIIYFMAELKSYPRNQIGADVDRWLKRMDLVAYKNRKVEELSKGMRQKLQFITTILHHPDLIILDELFSGLDPLNIELIKDVLLEEKRSGKTILFSTHVMEQAEKLCDHLCMINGGRKVIDGTLGDIKDKFGQNTLQIDIDGDSSFVKDLPGVARSTAFNNYIELELAAGTDSNAILRAIVERVHVRRYELVSPSLYSIFIRMAKADTSDTAAGQEAGHA